MLCQGISVCSGDLESLSLRRVLKCGAFGILLPDDSISPATLRKRRASAGRLAQSVGSNLLMQIDEERLLILRRRYVDQNKPVLCSQLLTEDMRLLRRVVWHSQQQCGLSSRVGRRWPPRHKRLGRPVHRPVPLPQEVSRLLAALSDLSARVVVGLAAGCGMLEGEILRLRAGHFKLARRIIQLPISGARGAPGRAGVRVVAIPEWVMALVYDAFPTLGGWSQSRLLFPHRDDPTRPRSSYWRTLRTAGQRADVEGWRTTDLRRMYQRAGRGSQLARCVVRGTDIHTSRQSVPMALYQREWLARRWSRLDSPPRGFWQSRRHVPRRGVGDALSPERVQMRISSPLRSTLRPLPPSCQVRGSEPTVSSTLMAREQSPAPRPAPEGALNTLDEMLCAAAVTELPSKSSDELPSKSSEQSYTLGDVLSSALLGGIGGMMLNEHLSQRK